jgi:hypothetical protein
MEIWRGPRGNNVKVYESEYFINEPDHKFDKIEITDSLLCGAKDDSPIEFKFINRNQFKMTNTEICYCTTTLSNLLTKQPLSLITPSHQQQVAQLTIAAIEQQKIPNFSDYLKQGYQVRLIGAIDFTYSNGQHSSPLSLHSSILAESN